MKSNSVPGCNIIKCAFVVLLHFCVDQFFNSQSPFLLFFDEDQLTKPRFEKNFQNVMERTGRMYMKHFAAVVWSHVMCCKLAYTHKHNAKPF